MPGTVITTAELVKTALNVLDIDEDDIPGGSLAHETELLLAQPVRIFKEGSRVVYRPEIDDDALAFAKEIVAANPGYARAYVLDVCRTEEGLSILETNCINAAGFYAADLLKLVSALDRLANSEPVM